MFIDLSLFWEIIESSFADELPKSADFYFGTSLTRHRQSSHSGEVLRSRLLPEPTRINHDGVTPASQSAVSATAARLSSSLANPAQLPAGDLGSTTDEVSILAQSYFAQGQDFVGSIDDWWFSGQTV